jgi:TetR/AcrR family transcriptional repressor of nem operon
MGEIGLTRGGFYKHFESKEALVVTAIDACWSEELNRLAQFATEHPDDPAARRSAFLDWYLSAEHRDDPGTGCPNVLAVAAARSEPASALRKAYIAGVCKLLALNGVDSRGTDPDEWQTHVLGELAILGGALMMVRRSESRRCSSGAYRSSLISPPRMRVRRRRWARRSWTVADWWARSGGRGFRA